MTGFINFILNLVSFKTGVYKAHPIAEGFQQEYFSYSIVLDSNFQIINSTSYRGPTKIKAEFVIAFHGVTPKSTSLQYKV